MAIAAHEAELGAPVDPDCIQIVSGSQQALDLMALAYIDEGSKVAVEDPTYLGALSAFKLQRPEICHSADRRTWFEPGFNRT